MLTNSTLSRPGPGLGGPDRGVGTKERTLTGWFGSGSAFAAGPTGLVYTTRQNHVSQVIQITKDKKSDGINDKTSF